MFLNMFQPFPKLNVDLNMFIQWFWTIFGLKLGSPAENNVGWCPPDLERPVGGGFPSLHVNLDASCTHAGGYNFDMVWRFFFFNCLGSYLF